MKAKWQKQWEEKRNEGWYYRIQRKDGEMNRLGRSRNERIISRMRFGHRAEQYII